MVSKLPLCWFSCYLRPHNLQLITLGEVERCTHWPHLLFHGKNKNPLSKEQYLKSFNDLIQLPFFQSDNLIRKKYIHRKIPMKDFPTHEGMIFSSFILFWSSGGVILLQAAFRRPRCQHYIHQGTRYNVTWWQDVVTRLPGSVATSCWSQLKQWIAVFQFKVLSNSCGFQYWKWDEIRTFCYWGL